MPAGRILLKSISESKKLSRLKTDSARLLYTWLIPHLDINGCFSGDAEVIKGKIFTRLKKSNKTVEGYLQDLERVKLITRYEVNGDVFLHSPDFVKKQPSLNPNKEGKSLIPLPTPELIRNYSRQSPELLSTSKVKESKNKVKESKSLCSKNKFSNVDIQLVQLLIDLIIKNDPKSPVNKMSKKQQETWLNECRKLREINERTPEEIEIVIRWTQQDSFEKTNVLSMPKLRKRFSQLFMKAKRDKGYDKFVTGGDW